MVDYFKTNWTQQMKMNPVANMILNGKPQPDSEYLEFRKVYRLKKTGPITLKDLFNNSTSISRKYDERYLEEVIGEDDWKEMAENVKATHVAEFMDKENKKANRINKAKSKKKARKQARALRKRRQQQQQQGQEQGQEQQQQQAEIEIDINAIDKDGVFENIRMDNDRMVSDAVVAHDKQTGAMAQLLGDQAKGQGDAAITTNTVAINIAGIDDEKRDLGERRNPFLMGDRRQRGDPGSDLDDEKGGYDSDDYVDVEDGINLGFNGDYHGESGMWDNTYVKDYLNIHHPKLLPDYYIQALKQQPLQIKPPSVFFSDV